MTKNNRNINQLETRATVRNLLILEWGEESKWPVLWDDITPSLPIWVDDNQTPEQCVAHIKEVVATTQSEQTVGVKN